MRKFFFIGILATLIFSGCSCDTVEAGNVGVLVDLYGGAKGVQEQVKPVGRYWTGMGQKLYVFPVFEQNYTWTREPDEHGDTTDESISFQTKEGLTVNADIGITYNIPPDNVVKVFQKYRRGVEEITDIFLRNHVRDSVNTIGATMPVEAVYGEGKAKLMEEVLKDVQSEVEPLGIHVGKVYLIGAIRLPDAVKSSLNAKVEATQKAMQIENELKQAEAEGRKRVAAAEAEAQVTMANAKAEAGARLAKAEAEAKSNALLNTVLTTQLLELRRLEVERARVEKWNGQLPTTIMGGGGTPMFNVSSLLAGAK